jgi:hypothetical protein
VLSNQLHSHLAASPEWDVSELGAGRFLDCDSDDLVFLL